MDNKQIDLHAPIKANWSIVSRDIYSVTMVAMCECGDNDCYWTLSAGVKDAFNQQNHRQEAQTRLNEEL